MTTPDAENVARRWDGDQLALLGDAAEIQIATSRNDGTERPARPIWAVRAGDEIYIRSYNGPDGSWYQQVLRRPEARIRVAGRDIRVRLVPVGPAVAGVDLAYRAKYGSGGYGAAMTRPAAAATTLRVEPA